MAPHRQAQAPDGRVRRRVAHALAKLHTATDAVAEADPSAVERAVRELGESRRVLAPVAWAAGTTVLLLRGLKLLIFNWRLALIQLVPAAWVWLAMWDLKQHTLRGSPFRQFTTAGTAGLVAMTIAVSIAAFWCNTVFAFAVDTSPPPRIRPALGKARGYSRLINASGVVLGCALAGAAIAIPRLDSRWLYALTLGAVLGFMLITFVAVPARIIGVRKQKLPPRQAAGRAAASGALSGIAMLPGIVLDRIALILIGVPGLRLLGFLLLTVGSVLYAAGMSSVKAVKMVMKLTSTDSTGAR